MRQSLKFIFMPEGISLAKGEFHAQSAFHKSRKGFISLLSVLKDTAHTFLFLFFTLLLGKSGNIHLKSVRTARTAYLVLSRLFGQSQNVSAFLASAVNVSLSVAYTVTLEAEKGHEAFSKPQKICVFLSATVEIL